MKEGEKGRKLRESILREQSEVASRMLAHLTNAERGILIEIMGKLLRSIGVSEK